MNTAPATCSLCGRPILVLDPNAMTIQRRQKQVLEMLLRSPGRFVAKSRIIDAIYGDDPDGGPDDAEGSVQAHISKLRRLLKPLGYSIESARFDGYRLQRTQERKA